MSGQQWDAERYDRDFAFVAAYGATILGWLDPQPGERVLDLGCGTGDLTLRLVEAGARVVGLDVDPAMAAAFAQRLPGVPLVVADAQQPWPSGPLSEQPFDAVFSNAALHWMPDAPAVASQMAAALRPGGRLAAELGGVGNVATIHDAVAGAVEDLGLPVPSWRRYFPTPGAYAAVLEDVGLEVRQLELADRPTRLSGPDGLADWIRLFGAGALGTLTVEQRDALVARAVERARPTLWQDGSWWADYRRLRVLAVKPATAAPAPPTRGPRPSAR
jgi:trans-aconitate methyltransferase